MTPALPQLTRTLWIAAGLLGAAQVAGASAPAVASARGAAAAQDTERESLERWLERARAARDSARARLAVEVEAVRAELDLLGAEPAPERERALVARLSTLGGEAAPLLVPWIDPGPEATPAALRAAALVAEALRGMDVSIVEDELLARLGSGSLAGRANAASVLARAPNPERAAPVLAEVFRTSEGSLQAAALDALLEMPGEVRRAVLREVLAGEDERLTNVALRALARAGGAEYREEVALFFADPERARQFAPALLAFYAACPSAVEKRELLGLVELANNPRLDLATRLAVIELLPQFETPRSNDLRRALEDLRDQRSVELQEAVLIALARLGDKGARRDVLAPYDEAIASNPEWAQRHAARADVLYRLGDPNEAIKGYKKALQVARDDPFPPTGIYVALARCYARLGKLKEAVQYLESSRADRDELAALAEEPVFRELAESEKYGEIFRAP